MPQSQRERTVLWSSQRLTIQKQTATTNQRQLQRMVETQNDHPKSRRLVRVEVVNATNAVACQRIKSRLADFDVVVLRL